MKKITKRNVLTEIAAVAFSDFTSFVSLETIPDKGQVMTIADTACLSKDCRRAVCSIKAGTKGVEIKLYDKLKALEMLGRVCGAFTAENDAEKEAVERLREMFETRDEFAPDE